MVQRAATETNAFTPRFTLDQKCAYLSHPACRDGIALLAQGLAKPIHLLERTETDTVAPDYALLRSLARLQSARIYVALADGVSDHATDVADDGLRHDPFTLPYEQPKR